MYFLRPLPKTSLDTSLTTQIEKEVEKERAEKVDAHGKEVLW